MNHTQNKAITFTIALIVLSMFIGLLNLANALYEEKTLFKHISITQKNILFCFAIISSPIWCPIIVYGDLIYSLIKISLNICHRNNPNPNPDIEAPVENIINDTHIDATDNTDNTELIVL